jgi:hypothetical protein
MSIFYIVLFFTHVSQLAPIICLLNGLKKVPISNIFLIYFLHSFLSTSFGLISAYFLNTSYPVFHVSMFLEFLILCYMLNKILEMKKLLLPFVLTSIIIFLFESVYKNGWFNNNEIFNLFFNASCSFLSFVYLIKLFPGTNLLNKRYFLIFISVLFVQSSSLLVISIYETQIRINPNFVAFILFLTYNFFEITQNIVNTWIIWKLKKA